jgi:flavin-dependent dehydrogenase
LIANRHEHEQDGVWDAVVIGAGPAGSVAALLLARRGFRVLLVDRCAFPRPKVCGGCLNRVAVDELKRLGLDQVVQGSGVGAYNRIRICDGERRATVALPPGRVVERATFDHRLATAAREAGAHVLTGASATILPEPADAAALMDTTRGLELSRRGHEVQQIKARVVIDATGLRGGADGGAWRGIGPARIGLGAVVEPARWPGPVPEPGELLMGCGRAGYVGLVWLGTDRLDVAAAVDPSAMRGSSGGPEATVVSIMADAGWPVDAHPTGIAWRGSPRMNRRRSSVAEHRLFRVGDAAGYVEPFTGEGMAWAITGAVALAPLAAQAIERWHPAHAGWWEQQIRQRRRAQFACRCITTALRRPRLRSALVGLLDRFPGLARPWVVSINRTRAGVSYA